MQKIATGWLKWRPDEFEYALMPDVLIAYEGYLDELKVIHGNGEKEDKQQVGKNVQDFVRAFGDKGVRYE